LRKGEQTLRADDRAGLCAKAGSKGFSKALVIDVDNIGNLTLNRMDCP
jgi:hypothetical protein